MSAAAAGLVGRPAASVGPSAESRRGWLSERGMPASVLVAAIATAFGVLLIAAVEFLTAMIEAEGGPVSAHATVRLTLSIVGALILAVAVYVAAIVTANTFSTVVAGRTREIALMRLIGASARSERGRVARRGVAVGAWGGGIGLVVGAALAAGAALVLPRIGAVDAAYPLFSVGYLLPPVIVTVTTWAAAWAGSRAVLGVSPLQALGASQTRTAAQLRSRGRSITAVLLTLLGAVGLAAGVVVGLISPVGVVIAFFGGVLSFTGIALGSTLFLPPLLRLTGALFGRGVAARLAAGNALRHPERASRMAMGLIIGITLVVMFAVASESAKAALVSASGGEQLAPVLVDAFDRLAAVMMTLMAVSAVIASVGLVNLLTLGIVQRRRELGLLRALGLSRGQVTAMVVLEGAHIALLSVVLGVLLGVAYGWAAAQSVFGSIVGANGDVGYTLVAPAVPWPIVGVIALAGAVLTLIAAAVPTRLATRVTAVEALAE